MCWNKGRLCWKTAKLFYFCHLKKLVRPETFGPYHVYLNNKQQEKRCKTISRICSRMIDGITDKTKHAKPKENPLKNRHSQGNEASTFGSWQQKKIMFVTKPRSFCTESIPPSCFLSKTVQQKKLLISVLISLVTSSAVIPNSGSNSQLPVGITAFENKLLRWIFWYEKEATARRTELCTRSNSNL